MAPYGLLVPTDSISLAPLSQDVAAKNQVQCICTFHGAYENKSAGTLSMFRSGKETKHNIVLVQLPRLDRLRLARGTRLLLIWASLVLGHNGISWTGRITKSLVRPSSPLGIRKQERCYPFYASIG
jgi:hypothetical protein